jgi:hypothetical protein
VSATDGLAAETIKADTWNNTGFFYVRVSGKNGQSSLDAPFAVSVTITGNQCPTIAPIGTAPTAADLHLSTGGSLRTLILWDRTRMSGDTAALDALQSKIDLLAARPDVAGVRIDLASNTRIQQLNAQADANIPCMYAKNLVAAGIKDIVNAYRSANPNLQYIVLVGGDKAIPFFRYPDQSLLGEEQTYGAPVIPSTASDASLRTNFVLGQDAYGASTELSLRASTFPVPDLAVGRLVETADEASGLIDAYLSTPAGVVATPTTSLVTGYDFLEDAANSVKADLDTGTGVIGDSLISRSTVAPGTLCSSTLSPPDCSWDATALRTTLLGARHDLIFLAGHFSANNALAADYTTTMNATDLAGASSLDLTNSIIFSAGCHSGYNIVDADATSATNAVDWSQAIARRKATLIAGTGYQYGDTDFLEYSERIYAEFAHQLRVGTGPVSIGQAFLRAKQIYLASTPEIRGLHEKALLEATIFGLPMLSINMPGTRDTLPSTSSIVTTPTAFATNPGLTLGLRSADVSLNPATTARTVELAQLDDSEPPLVVGDPITATYYQGRDGVVTNPGEPAIPLQSENVSVPGKVLRGVGFLGGTYTDSTVVPLTGAAATEIRGIHNAFSSTVFYPMRPWTVNYYDALASGGGATRLLVTPAQHKVANLGDQTATLRRYSNVNLRLFYSDYLLDAAQSAAPTITGVQASAAGSVVTVQARVTGNPAAGIQQVWITHNGTLNAWTSVNLSQSGTDSTLWTGTFNMSGAQSPDDARFMVQAVNGVGLVGMDDNLGAYHTLTRPTIEATIASGTLGSNGWYRSDVIVHFTCRTATGSAIPTGCPADQTLSAEGSSVSSSSTATVTDAAGITSRPANIITVKIDKTKPTVSLVGGPADGSSHYFGSVPPAPTCTASDALSGLNGCALSDFITTVGGPHTVTATARDQAGNENSASKTYTVLAWDVLGFYQPTDMPDVWNVVKNGATVPLKFEIFVGPTERTDIASVQSLLKYRQTSCPGGTTDDIELLASGSTTLRYDSTAGQFIFNWQTPKVANACYVVTVTAADGTWKSANFRLK